MSTRVCERPAPRREDLLQTYGLPALRSPVAFVQCCSPMTPLGRFIPLTRLRGLNAFHSGHRFQNALELAICGTTDYRGSFIKLSILFSFFRGLSQLSCIQP